jgi:PPP family 3-phenylpropionic acid transporter
LPIATGCVDPFLSGATSWRPSPGVFYFFATDYTAILLITLVYGVFYTPIIAFMETFTMEILGAERLRYGQIRVWGTLAFIAMVVVMGRLIDRYSIDIIIGAILAGALLQALVSTRVPDIDGAGGHRKKAAYGFLSRRPVVVFLCSAFLMLVSHGTYYGFFSIHLENVGYGSTFIGFAWALASVAEAGVMLASDRIFKKIPIGTVLLVSFAGAALRWVVLWASASWWVLLVSQGLHALTYAAFHVASILYIDRLSPSSSKTLGQSLNNALTFGLGMMVGFLLNGWLYDRWGAPWLFLMSGGIAFAGGILLALFGQLGRAHGQVP